MSRLDELVANLAASLSVAAAQLDRAQTESDEDDREAVSRAYIRAYGYLRGAVAAHIEMARR